MFLTARPRGELVKEEEKGGRWGKGTSFGVKEPVKRIFKRCRHSRGPWDTPVSELGGVGVRMCLYSLVLA